MLALPLPAAIAIGVSPYRLATVACAPAPSSSFAIAASSTRTAQCSAGDPSVPGALTSTFCAIRARTAAMSRFMAASASRVSTPAAAAPRGAAKRQQNGRCADESLQVFHTLY